MKITQGRDNSQNITTSWFIQAYGDYTGAAPVAPVKLPEAGKPIIFSCMFNPPDSIAGKRCSMSNTAFGFMNNSAVVGKIQGCALYCSGLTFPYNTESFTQDITPGDTRASTLVNIIRFPEFTNNIGPSVIVNVPSGPTLLTFTIDRPPINSDGLTANDRIYLCMQFEPME